MKIGIGIDTGGTYTDAVIYNFENKSILGTAKSLTTKNDLSIGILGAIDGLPAHLTREAELISLSTTLATNACVEDRGGRAKLIFFGANKKVIDENGGKYGLPPSKDIYIQESFTNFEGEMEREPDWELFGNQLENGFEHLDGAGIVEIYAVRNGAVVEKKAKEIFQKKHDMPVVCGHELFSELNCLQRGSSTLLNARLFPVIKEFIAAVKKALSVRGINASIVMVRSDGSMMSEKFASLHPVETLLCGPAASAISGARLTGNPNSIIVDMGGTTTDIAVVKDRVPVTVIDGVSIGKWKTFVDGLYIKTFGLGGDSAIHYDYARKLYLEEYRVVPLCVAAHKYPSVTDNLKKLLLKKHSHFLYEHYMLVRDISENARYTDEEKKFCDALKEKPLAIAEAAEAVGKELYTLDVKRLIKDGIVQICGLTPTDIMHIKGDFSKYCSEASLLGAEFAAHNLDVSAQKICDLAYTEVKRKLYLNIVKAMLENKHPDYMKNGVNKDVERFINDNYREMMTGNHDKLLSAMFQTEYTLVGIGAPIHIFLDDLAKMLGTHSVIPKHYEVANALGAVIGSISASHSVEIKPNNNAEGTTGYTVFGNNENRVFEEMENALEYAVSQAREGAEAEAVRRGAVGKLTVSSGIHRHDAEASEDIIYLGATVTARAVGAVGFYAGT
jgi:N-methylhydantoinase A/oxoprolinase/acetone carboxylase beta subunit